MVNWTDSRAVDLARAVSRLLRWVVTGSEVRAASRHYLISRGSQHPQPPARGTPSPTARTANSSLAAGQHSGLGERPGETDRKEYRHRAPGRVNHKRRRLFREGAGELPV